MNLSPRISLHYRDTFTFTDNSQFLAMGTIGETSDGRKYRWVKAGASTLVVGNVLQAPVSNTSQVDLAVNTALMVVGASQITVTPGAAIVANQFQGGKLLVSNGGGFGYMYTLGSHLAGNSTVNVVFNIVGSEAVQAAANSTTRVDLIAPSFNGVIQMPTAATAYPVGVAVAPITNGQYGWVQTGGVCGVLIDGTPAIDAAVMPSTSVAGAAAAAVQTAQAANTATTSTVIGRMVETGVAGKAKAVFLTLDA